jgi:hypothetical protein
MADTVMFPGTKMDIIEKYPGSRRLDHPDFADVAKTVYAKGVITDFKRPENTENPDDPITVESMVKVEGDFGESDYIPLFYHPKEGYWDDEFADPPVLATDFDEETGAFKQAWMSFRCGDEVVVMLKEGTPVAVMGFADGVPRVGEDVVQVIAPHSNGTSRFFHLQCSKLGEDGLYGGLDVVKTGPDGLELGLTEESGPSPENYYQRPASQYYPDSSGDERNYGWLTNYEQPSPGGTNLHREITSIKHNYLEFIFVVGPILYIVQVLASKSTILYKTFDLGYGNDPPYHFEPTNGIPLDQGLRVVSGGDCPYSPGPDDVAIGSIPNFWSIIDIQYRAAIYSKELLDAIEAAGPNSAEQAYNDYIAHGWNYEWGTKYPDTFWQTSGIYNVLASLFSYSTWPKWDDTIFIVRPHTKEELQEAGMWPAE